MQITKHESIVVEFAKLPSSNLLESPPSSSNMTRSTTILDHSEPVDVASRVVDFENDRTKDLKKLVGWVAPPCPPHTLHHTPPVPSILLLAPRHAGSRLNLPPHTQYRFVLNTGIAIITLGLVCFGIGSAAAPERPGPSVSFYVSW